MNKKLLITLAIAAAIILLGAGGYFLAKNVIKDVVEEAFDQGVEQEEDSTNTNKDDESSDEIEDVTVSTNGGNWFSDIPSDIPEFKYGDIQSTASGESGSQKSWTLIYENVDSDDFDNYKSDLENKGFSNISSYTVDNDKVIMLNNEPYTVLVTYSSDDGTIGLSITRVLE